MSISLKNLNAFIIEILTIDYSYLWASMEVVVSNNGTLMQVCDESLTVDPKEGTFTPFEQVEIGVHYDKKAYSNGPDVNLLQSAITDLLNLTDEQKLAQVNRLNKLEAFWRYDPIIGISEEGLIYEILYDRNKTYGFNRISLLLFQDMVVGQGVINKNIPSDIDKICLSATFYTTFECYIYPKIFAIHRLIEATGVKAGFWSEPNFQSDLSAKESDNDNALNKDYDSEIDGSNKRDSQEVEITVMAVALACVYLEKVGFFKGGTLKSQITTHILSKFSYSYDSLYNRMCGFRDDNTRIKAGNIIDINRAIKILPVFELASPIAIAETDLKIIREKNRS